MCSNTCTLQLVTKMQSLRASHVVRICEAGTTPVVGATTVYVDNFLLQWSCKRKTDRRISRPEVVRLIDTHLPQFHVDSSVTSAPLCDARGTVSARRFA